MTAVPLRPTTLVRMHGRLGRAIEWMDRAILLLTSVILVVIVVLGAAEIFSRYVLNHSLFFVFEVTVLLANYMYFLGFCLVAKRRGDITLEYFVNFLSPRARRILSLVAELSAFYFLYVLVHYGFNLLVIQSRHSSEGLNIPNHLFTLPLFLGALVLVVIGVQRIIETCIGTEEQ